MWLSWISNWGFIQLILWGLFGNWGSIYAEFITWLSEYFWIGVFSRFSGLLGHMAVATLRLVKHRFTITFVSSVRRPLQAPPRGSPRPSKSSSPVSCTWDIPDSVNIYIGTAGSQTSKGQHPFPYFVSRGYFCSLPSYFVGHLHDNRN